MQSTSFTLGCGPELGVRLNGISVSADRYFKSNSSCRIDGNGYSMEIRPGYSESPLDLTSKIYQILEYGHDKAPDLEFYSGHYVDGYAIGGHTHFSLEPTEDIINALDTVLGSLSSSIGYKQQRSKGIQTA